MPPHRGFDLVFQTGAGTPGTIHCARPAGHAWHAPFSLCGLTLRYDAGGSDAGGANSVQTSHASAAACLAGREVVTAVSFAATNT